MTRPLTPTPGPILSRRALIAGAGAALALQGGPGRAQILGTEGATAYVRALGAFELTAILDGFIEIPTELLVGADAAEVAASLTAANRDPARPVPTGITAHLLRTPDQLVLIDAGAGTAFGPAAGRLAAGLAAAGVAPGDVALALVTHMHADHVGGLLAADGTAAFPNAEVRVAEAELAFWTDDANVAAAPEAARPTFEVARAVVAAYGERLVPFAADAEMLTGVTAMALPGHTPGQSGFHLESDGQRLLLWADVVHMAAIQLPLPEASMVFDTDPAMAAETRARVLDMAASEDLLLGGAHMPFPAFGYADAAAGGGYAWRPEDWAYR